MKKKEMKKMDEVLFWAEMMHSGEGFGLYPRRL